MQWVLKREWLFSDESVVVSLLHKCFSVGNYRRAFSHGEKKRKERGKFTISVGIFAANIFCELLILFSVPYENAERRRIAPSAAIQNLAGPLSALGSENAEPFAKMELERVLFSHNHCQWLDFCLKGKAFKCYHSSPCAFQRGGRVGTNTARLSVCVYVECHKHK